MEGLPKERNIPPKEELGPKRFEIQPDSFVSERLSAVQSGVEEMREEDPNVLGVTLYGSMVKGTAHEGSDVDGYLYLDADRLAREESELATQENREPRPVTFDVGDVGNVSTYPGEHLYDVYKPLIKDKFTKDGLLNEEQISDINIRPISGEIIDRHLSSLKQGLELARNGENDVNIEPSQNLFGLFHLAVGHGLDSHRQQIIEKLEGMGQEGEEVWSKIIGQTEKLEQYMYTDTPIRYPRTLAEARNRYIPKTEQGNSLETQADGNETWPENATAEAYEAYEEPLEVQMYSERKQEYRDVISQWDEHIHQAVAEDGHVLSEEELHHAIDMRERMIQEMVEVSANYPGDWTELLHKRAIDPVTKEKFSTQRTEAMLAMKDGAVPEQEQGNKYGKRYTEHYQRQMDKYGARVSNIFSHTNIEVGGATRAATLGSGNIDKPGTVYLDAHKDGVPLTDKQKNIIEAHEKMHGLFDSQSPTDKLEIRSIFDEEAVSQLQASYEESRKRGVDTKFNRNYLENPDEIIARLSQFKNYFGMSADEEFTKKHLDQVRKRYISDTGLDNGVSDLLSCVTPQTEQAFLKVINKYPI